MKVKLYTHKLKANIQDDLPKVVAYFKKHNIDLVIDIEETSILKQDANVKLFLPNDGKYEVVIYMFDRAEFYMQSYGLCFSFSKTLQAIYLACDVANDNVDYTWKSMCHELVHSLVYKYNNENNTTIYNALDFPIVNGKVSPYYGNEDLDLVGGNFDQQWKLLAPYLKKGYKYFSPAEVAKWKLKPELFTLLDDLRGKCGFPFIINSGLRTKAENDALQGSVSESSHLSGLAVDLSITDSLKRFKLVQNALLSGITRIGVGKTFIHLDIDKTKPQNVMWEYN